MADTPSQAQPGVRAGAGGHGGPAGPGRSRRTIGVCLFVVAFTVWALTVGVPTDPVSACAWLWLLTIAWNNTRHWIFHLRFARDWLPVLAVLVAYSYSRGLAYDTHTTAHVYEMVALDHAMFGVTPSVWLQHHLYDPRHIHVWDVAASFVYFSHFVVVYLVAAVLWIRDRAQWGAFMRRWMLLTFAGLATYLLYPAAPPWWAAKYGLVEPIARISGRGWNAIGLHGAGNMLRAAQVGANPVAAMPSLHFAFTVCVALFFALRVRRRWIPVLALYPLAMGFTLSYTGEHHVTDMLAGVVYVVVSFALVSAAEHGWRRYRSSRQVRRALADGEGRRTGSRSAAEPDVGEVLSASRPLPRRSLAPAWSRRVGA